MSFKRLLFLWLPVLVWAGLIFFLSSIPYLRITQAWWDHIARKAAHMVIFGIFARLVARALTRGTFWSWRRIFAWSLVSAFLYACSDEYHQNFVPGRNASATDVAIDTFGAWIALGMKP